MSAVDLAIDDDRVGELVLNRPEKLNAIDDEMVAVIHRLLDEALTAGARALILRGNGRAFCAGRDLTQRDPTTDDGERILREIYNPLMRRLADLPLPTFAAVHGACLGAGLGIALACDVVYVADDARLGSPFSRIGAVLDSGGHAYFVERLGAHRALELIYGAEFLSGAEAAAWGLVNRSVPPDELAPRVRALAQRAAAGPAIALRESKRIVRRIEDERLGFAAILELEAVAQGIAFGTRDYLEGVAAFREKRPPRFEGR